MNKSKYYIGVIIFLLCSNLVLTFFLLKKPGRHNHNPKRIVIERLEFSPEQILEYELLIEKHQQKMFSEEHKLADARQLLYTELLKDSSDSSTDSILLSISNLEKKLIKTNFEHFNDIKKLCQSEEQQASFENLVSDLSKIFSKRKGPHPPPH